jgi:peptide/nickel transport system permease protein
VRLASIAGTVPAPGSWPTGCRFASRCRFAREKCTTPFPEIPAHGDGAVLCIRVDEIARAGVTWAPEQVGAEIAPDAEVEPASPAGVSS